MIYTTDQNPDAGGVARQNTIQKKEFTVHRCVAEDAPWASSQKTHTPRKASHQTPQKARTRVAEDATRTRAVAEDCLFIPR